MLVPYLLLQQVDDLLHTLVYRVLAGLDAQLGLVGGLVGLVNTSETCGEETSNT